jgi:hypothetical protein
MPELKGTKIVAVPGHDTAAAYDAMPANLAGGDLYISSGTWSLVGFESDTPVLGNEALAARISNERIGDGPLPPVDQRHRPCGSSSRTLKDFAARPKNDQEWERLISAAEALGSNVGGTLRPDDAGSQKSGDKTPPTCLLDWHRPRLRQPPPPCGPPSTPS